MPNLDIFPSMGSASLWEAFQKLRNPGAPQIYITRWRPSLKKSEKGSALPARGRKRCQEPNRQSLAHSSVCFAVSRKIVRHAIFIARFSRHFAISNRSNRAPTTRRTVTNAKPRHISFYGERFPLGSVSKTQKPWCAADLHHPLTSFPQKIG